MLDRGEARSAAAIAERSGLCAVYVRNILHLLRLHPAILAHIERLQAGDGETLTERWLRPVTRLPFAEQLMAVAERIDVGLEEEGCG